MSVINHSDRPALVRDREVARAPAAGAGIVSAAVFLIITLLTCVGLYRQRPTATGADAPAPAFSSARASAHIKNIAQRPHPMGSEEHASVRDYISQALAAQGVESQLQETATVGISRGATTYAGTVHNVVARLSGTENRKAVLLAGHYDTMPTSPGASDDSSAVAVMLETLRALKSGPPLKNDVIFLFTDGEEVGLLGATAFVEQHPWAKDVGVVLNFEARGSGGAALMFETSQQNGWLISEFAQAVPYPAANSFMYEIYRVLPNDTDFSVFKRAGYDGLNFAYIEDPTRYHTRLDTLEELDERSLQQQGSYALALARQFGNRSFESKKGANAVYFDLFSMALPRYSQTWVLPLTVVVLALFIAALIKGLRARRLSIWKIVQGSFVVLLNMICGLLLSLVAYLLYVVDGGRMWTPDGNSYSSGILIWGFIALTIALSTALFLLVRNRIGADNIAFGAMSWWLLLLLLTALVLPGGSYLFTWPLLFGVLANWFLFKVHGQSVSATKRAVVLVLVSVPALVIFVPIIQLLLIALPLLAVGAAMLFLVLLIWLLAPQLDLVMAQKRWSLPAAALGTAVILLVVGSIARKPDALRPRQDSIFYGLNADTGKAVWATADDRLDEWTTQFIRQPTRDALKEFFPAGGREFLRGDAPQTAVPVPRVDILEDQTKDSVRRVRMRIASSRQANCIYFSPDPETKVISAAINGRPLTVRAGATQGEDGGQWTVYYYAPPAAGIEVLLEVVATQPLKLTVVDRTHALPQISGQSYPGRPDNTIPTPYSYNDTTLVSKAFVF